MTNRRLRKQNGWPSEPTVPNPSFARALQGLNLFEGIREAQRVARVDFEEIFCRVAARIVSIVEVKRVFAIDTERMRSRPVVRVAVGVQVEILIFEIAAHRRFALAVVQIPPSAR